MSDKLILKGLPNKKCKLFSGRHKQPDPEIIDIKNLKGNVIAN